MRRLHNSKQPVGALHAVPQDAERLFKPRGLWYGIGEAWLDWCREEMPDWVGEYTYDVRLVRGANLLRLATVTAIEDFTTEFQTMPPDLRRRDPEFWRGHYIDWPRVAAQWDGIEIAPYQWALRLAAHTFWYYGWDCASGCIWHPRAIKAVTPYVGRSAIAASAARDGPA